MLYEILVVGGMRASDIHTARKAEGLVSMEITRCNILTDKSCARQLQ